MPEIVTTTSWIRRIIGAFTGMLFGLILIVVAFFLISWNETHGLHMAQSLAQTQKILVPVPDSPIDPAHDLKVVYVSGQAKTSDYLSDPLFHVSVNALSLIRHVEMYEWKETSTTKTENQTGGSQVKKTTYSYQPIWADHLIDSTQFNEPQGHQNPGVMPLLPHVQYAQTVTVGDFVLPETLIQQMSGATSLNLSTIDLGAVQHALNRSVQHIDEAVYVGDKPETPVISDMKISFSAILPQPVSIIAQQTGHTLQGYAAPAGEIILLLTMGQASSQALIQKALSHNALFTWIYRGVACLLMVIGLSLLMQPLVILADFIPFLGAIVGAGTGLIAFCGGFILSALAISIIWFAIRPVFALSVLLITVAVVSGLFYRQKQKRTKTQP
jgi:hypothetical protein